NTGVLEYARDGENARRADVRDADGLTAVAPPHRAALPAAAPGGVVPRRVSRLLEPPPAAVPPLLAAVPVGLALFSVVWTGEGLLDLAELLRAAAR
ncbi:M56 family peptidase, partial [Dactylosporangium sp. NPDC051485]